MAIKGANCGHKEDANVKDSLHRSYMAECIGNTHDSTAYPKLRTYKLFKDEFKFENYLSSTKNLNHTLALFRFRISSHNLRIETGHYTRPQIPVNQGRAHKQSCKLIISQIELCVSIKVSVSQFHFIGFYKHLIVQIIYVLCMYTCVCLSMCMYVYM